MKKRLLDLILKNTGLKITALIFAIILWFFVVSVNDPDNTRTMVVPVQVVNADVLEETNEYYVLTGKTTVTFQALLRSKGGRGGGILVFSLRAVRATVCCWCRGHGILQCMPLSCRGCPLPLRSSQ